MLNDKLGRDDIENAILKGRIDKKLTEDIRGTRYRIEGPSIGGKQIHGYLHIQRRRESYYNNSICLNGGHMICEFCGGQTAKKEVKR